MTEKDKKEIAQAIVTEIHSSDKGGCLMFDKETVDGLRFIGKCVVKGQKIAKGFLITAFVIGFVLILLTGVWHQIKGLFGK